MVRRDTTHRVQHALQDEGWAPRPHGSLALIVTPCPIEPPTHISRMAVRYLMHGCLLFLVRER